MKSGSKKQKRVKQVNDEFFSILIVENTVCAEFQMWPDVIPKPKFHMVEVKKEEHEEIYKDLEMFEKEGLELHVDFVHYQSPFVGLKSKSGNYATQEMYEDSDEFIRWEYFVGDYTEENKNMIRFTGYDKGQFGKLRILIFIKNDDCFNCLFYVRKILF